MTAAPPASESSTVTTTVNMDGGAPPKTASPRSEPRPLGVAILSLLVVLYGIGAVALGILTLFQHPVGLLQKYVDWVPSLSSYSGTVGAIVTAVVGVILIAVAVGLWRLSMAALGLAILVLLYELVVFGLARQFETIGFILALVIILYLVAVSRHFR